MVAPAADPPAGAVGPAVLPLAGSEGEEVDGALRKRLAMAAACALLTAGCGADEGSGGAVPPASPAGAPTVQMNNFSYQPARVAVPAGSSIEVRNGNAATTHTFTVGGTGIDVEVPPLASAGVAIDLPPGRYRVVCRFHAAQGMEGTLVVT